MHYLPHLSILSVSLDEIALSVLMYVCLQHSYMYRVCVCVSSCLFNGSGLHEHECKFVYIAFFFFSFFAAHAAVRSRAASMCAHASIFRLPPRPANEIFIYFCEPGRRVARNSNEMSYLIVSSSEEGGNRGNTGTELLLNYIGRIQRGVITRRRGGGGLREKEGESNGEEKG